MPRRRTKKFTGEELREYISTLPPLWNGTKKSVIFMMLIGTGFLAWLQNSISPVELKAISKPVGWLFFGLSVLWTLVLVPGYKEARIIALEDPTDAVRRLQTRAAAIRFYFWRGGILGFLCFGMLFLSIATLSSIIASKWAILFATAGPSFAVAISFWKRSDLLRAWANGWPLESWWSKMLMILFFTMAGLARVIWVNIRLIIHYGELIGEVNLFAGVFLIYATAYIQPHAIGDFLAANTQRRIQKEEMAIYENNKGIIP